MTNVPPASPTVPALRRKENPAVRSHAERIFPGVPKIQDDTQGRVRAVLNLVLADPFLAAEYNGAAIRYITICGLVSQKVLIALGNDPSAIGVLAIGDVDLPPFVRKIVMELRFSKHDFEWELEEEEGDGYDLASQGSEKSRKAMFEYFDTHYGFSASPGLLEKLTENSTIVGGGMRGLDDIATSMVDLAERMGKIHRFIQPDNSFGTWHEIVKGRSINGKVAKVHTLGTDQKDLLHLTAEKVNKFYKEHPTSRQDNDSWYITPVGNPSGTCMKPEQLVETCEAIIQNNPKAVIILDCVYLRTLKPQRAKELMRGIISDETILKRIIFVESFSKTHGLCGERLGAYFCANKELYGSVQNTNMKISAGNGREKSAWVRAIANATPEQQDAFNYLHKFWAAERLGLYHFLIKNPKFKHLFDDRQDHILEEQLHEPLGLYVFLKLRPGVTIKQVAIETGCLGVLTPMADGNYIRLAVGKITQPTYAQYAYDASMQGQLLFDKLI